MRCASPDDLAAAIRYGRENDLELGVRCGGHSVVGHAYLTTGWSSAGRRYGAAPAPSDNVFHLNHDIPPSAAVER